MLHEMVAQIVVRGLYVGNVAVAALLEMRNENLAIRPAALGLQEFRRLCLHAAIGHGALDQLILPFGRGLLVRRRGRLHHLLQQVENRVLADRDVLRAFGDRPALRRGLEVPLDVRKPRDRIEKNLARRMEVTHSPVPLALLERRSRRRRQRQCSEKHSHHRSIHTGELQARLPSSCSNRT